MLVFTVAHFSQQFQLIYLNILLMLRIFHIVFTVAKTLHYQHQYSTFRHYKQNSQLCLTASEYLPQQTATQVQSNQYGITLQLHLTTAVSETAQP